MGKAACLKDKRTLLYRMYDMLLDYDCIETPLQRKKFVKKLAPVLSLIQPVLYRENIQSERQK